MRYTFGTLLRNEVKGLKKIMAEADVVPFFEQARVEEIKTVGVGLDDHSARRAQSFGKGLRWGILQMVVEWLDAWGCPLGAGKSTLTWGTASAGRLSCALPLVVASPDYP